MYFSVWSFWQLNQDRQFWFSIEVHALVNAYIPKYFASSSKFSKRLCILRSTFWKNLWIIDKPVTHFPSNDTFFIRKVSEFFFPSPSDWSENSSQVTSDNWQVTSDKWRFWGSDREFSRLLPSWFQTNLDHPKLVRLPQGSFCDFFIAYWLIGTIRISEGFLFFFFLKTRWRG